VASIHLEYSRKRKGAVWKSLPTHRADARFHQTMTNLKQKLSDREYRAAYAESFLDTFIASQIRVLREQRGWTQGKLAEQAGMKQSRISALEDANYSSWTLGTLKRLARAFDVPLFVGFGTFGSLLADVNAFGRRSLGRPAFAEDPVLLETGTIEQTASTGADLVITKEIATCRVLPFKPRQESISVTVTTATSSGGLLQQAAIV
jgi:transcriptional regulator with XRE-family HTH domain